MMFDWLINAAYYVIPFIVLLGILVFVHELGHFLTARICGVRVAEFSIGFGKKLWGFTDKSGTEWKLCAVPLGGYCKFLGDADAASAGDESDKLSDEDKKFAFAFQNPFKKLAIVFAGPAANYLFAIVIFAGIFFFWGKVDYPPIVGDVISGGAAEQAGILSGDKVVTINHKKIETFLDIQREIDLNTAPQVQVQIERNQKIIDLAITLKTIPLTAELNQEAAPKPMLGIRSVSTVAANLQNVPLDDALVMACQRTLMVTEATLRGIGQMISGQRNTDEVGGIIRIAEMSGDISKDSSLIGFLTFMSLLSINLGLINLFPIPVLDGGHVVIYLIEIVTGREMNQRFKDYIFRLGLFLIIALMLFATYNDCARLFHRWFS